MSETIQGSDQTLNVTRYTRLAMESIFQRGYQGPTHPSNGPRQPKPHSVVTFNVPRKAVPSDAKTLYDIFAGITHYNSCLNVYTKLLGMLSMGVTRPSTGYGADVGPG